MSENAATPSETTDSAADAPDQNWATGRPVHFEIQAADPQRAIEFYTTVFGWSTEDWSEFAGMPYFGVTTGTGPGIDGPSWAAPAARTPRWAGPSWAP